MSDSLKVALLVEGAVVLGIFIAAVSLWGH